MMGASGGKPFESKQKEPQKPEGTDEQARPCVALGLAAVLGGGVAGAWGGGCVLAVVRDF